MKNNKPRNLSIDLLKVLCTLWIVGYWHLSNYGEAIDPYAWSHSREITVVSLGVFMFFSGFFLSKYKITSKIDVIEFYKKRVKRFYGLYLMSVLMLYVGSMFTPKPWFKSDFQLISTIFGISTFFKPSVGTLWFMSMLMLFYWITPLVKLLNSKNKQFLAITIVYLMCILLYLFTGGVDARLFWLMPMYIIGLFISHDNFNRLCKGKSGYVCIAAFIVCLYIPWPNNIFITTIRNITLSSLVAVGGGKICMVSMRYFEKYPIIVKTIDLFSYCSLSVYLFHREVYQALTMILSKLHIDITISILYIVFFPIAFVSAYLIQRCYDYVINKYFEKKDVRKDI